MPPDFVLVSSISRLPVQAVNRGVRVKIEDNDWCLSEGDQFGFASLQIGNYGLQVVADTTLTHERSWL